MEQGANGNALERPVMQAPIRVALIGCGDIAEHGHLPSVLGHKAFELVGLCDIRPQRLEHLGKLAPHVQRDHDFHAFIDRADAFILALHPEVSVDVAADLLSRGGHVLDEKPLAVSLDDACRLGRVVQASSSIYQIGFIFRFCDFARGVKATLQQVGKPYSLNIRVFDERLDWNNQKHVERMFQILRTSSAITHEGSHLVDLARFWNSSPFDSVVAVTARTHVSMPGPNIWHATARHEDGSMVHMEIGWLLPLLPANALEAVGPNGYFSAPLAGGHATRRIVGQEVQRLAVPRMQQMWSRQLDCFAQAIRTGRPVGPTFEDGLQALKTTLACETATRTSL